MIKIISLLLFVSFLGSQKVNAATAVKCLVYDGTYFFQGRASDNRTAFEAAMKSCEDYHKLEGASRGPLDCRLHDVCKPVRVAKKPDSSNDSERSSYNSGSCSPAQVRAGCTTVYTGAAMITRNPSCACPN